MCLNDHNCLQFGCATEAIKQFLNKLQIKILKDNKQKDSKVQPKIARDINL